MSLGLVCSSSARRAAYTRGCCRGRWPCLPAEQMSRAIPAPCWHRWPSDSPAPLRLQVTCNCCPSPLPARRARQLQLCVRAKVQGKPAALLAALDLSMPRSWVDVPGSQRGAATAPRYGVAHGTSACPAALLLCSRPVQTLVTKRPKYFFSSEGVRCPRKAGASGKQLVPGSKKSKDKANVVACGCSGTCIGE